MKPTIKQRAALDQFWISGAWTDIHRSHIRTRFSAPVLRQCIAHHWVKMSDTRTHVQITERGKDAWRNRA